jgi:crotonobetainyl-CoA:carnitine CoA-transferase CaiB-like acyl-CoA transferase
LLADAVPCSVVRPVDDMFDHPQVQTEDIVSTIPHPVLGNHQSVTRPINKSRTPGPAPFAAPGFGQSPGQIGEDDAAPPTRQAAPPAAVTA